MRVITVCAGEGMGLSANATYSFELVFYEPLESDVRTLTTRFDTNKILFPVSYKYVHVQCSILGFFYGGGV